MIEHLKAGMKCWHVTDCWSVCYALHVTVRDVDAEGLCRVRWRINLNDNMDFEDVRPSELYATKHEAQAAARAERERIDRIKRGHSGMPNKQGQNDELPF
jgi:aspartate aminotransferase-like enzyme